MMNPFVKWAGGKRQILKMILEIIKMLEKETDKKTYTFFEPFVGGGIVFLRLKHHNININDLNKELMNAYKIIKNDPVNLMLELDKHLEKYLKDDEYFYEVRGIDREERYDSLTNTEKAARMIFLNKTCYNGLYRVNSLGKFNTPKGRYKKPKLYDRDNIMRLNKYFNSANIDMSKVDYSIALKKVKKGDIIYADPPYDYGDEKGFTQYQLDGFTFDDFKRLKSKLDECINEGAFVIISNNETERVVDLFGSDPKYRIYYDVKKFSTNRTINSNPQKRKTGKEIIIVGMQLNLPQADSLDKIAKLIRIKDQNRLESNDKIAEVLEVKGLRTVHYYLAALRYLEVINVRNKFTEKGRKLRSLNRATFEIELAKTILQKKIFKECYDKENEMKIELNNAEIKSIIRKYYKSMSEQTIKRRARTMRKWLDWCHNVLNYNSINESIPE